MDVAEDCKRTVEVEIPVGEVDREYSRIARDYQKQARIPGFRPGHAPLSLVRQRFEDKIRDEVLKELLPAHLQAAFRRDNVEPVSRPVVEDLHFHAGEPIRFKAVFEVLPAFDLGDYRSVRVEMPEVVVSDEDVEAMIEQQRQRRAVMEDVASAEGEAAPVAADGLIAVVSSERRMEGEDEVATTEGTEVEVGNPDTLPEFNQALQGAAVGEVRELDVTYPEDFGSETFAGKTAHYSLKVTAIKRRILPALDDQFASEVSEFETLGELRQRLRENIEAERRHEAHHKTEESILDKVLELHSFPLPAALVEEQINSRLERSLRSLQSQGLDPRKLNLDWAALRERQREAAGRDVRVSLLLDKIADAEGFEPSDDEVNEQVERFAQQLKQPLEAVRARLTEDGMLDSIKSRIRNQKTMELLFETATGVKPDPHADHAAPEE